MTVSLTGRSVCVDMLTRQFEWTGDVTVELRFSAGGGAQAEVIPTMKKVKPRPGDKGQKSGEVKSEGQKKKKKWWSVSDGIVCGCACQFVRVAPSGYASLHLDCYMVVVGLRRVAACRDGAQAIEEKKSW